MLDVRLGGPLSEAEVDAHSESVLEAIERHAADIALGPVLTLDFDQPAVNVRFIVEAASYAELHERVSQVVAVVEREANAPIIALNTTSDFPEAEG